MDGRVDSRQAWLIAIAALALASISLGAPYVAIVGLKPMAADFGLGAILGLRILSARATAHCGCTPPCE